jgi:hypothetical protein
MSTGYTTDDLFRHDVPEASVIAQVDAQTDSWVHRVDSGWKLVWRAGGFSQKKGAPIIRRVYLTWLTPDGADINAGKRGLPAAEIVAPTGAVKAFYINPDDMFRFNEDVERAVQKIEFHAPADTDTATCLNWQRFADAMDVLFVDDLVAFLVHNVDDHDLLNDGDRALIADEGAEVAIKSLKRMMLDGMNRSYHRYSWAGPKHKIMRQRYVKTGNTDLVKVAPKDADLLQTPEYGRVLDYINKSTSFWMLNLLPIYLPDGTPVQPDQYNRLNSNGALASMTITIYGVNRRPDGQHSIMGSNTGTHLVTNGSSAQAIGTSLNIMAMRGKRKAEELPAPVLNTKQQAMGRTSPHLSDNEQSDD